MPHKWADWLHNPCRMAGPRRFREGWIGSITSAVWRFPNASDRERKSAVAHKWEDGLHNPCRLGGPQRFRAGQNHQWPTNVRVGCITPAVWGVPNASERGRKSASPLETTKANQGHHWRSKMNSTTSHCIGAPLHKPTIPLHNQFTHILMSPTGRAHSHSAWDWAQGQEETPGSVLFPKMCMRHYYTLHLHPPLRVGLLMGLRYPSLF